MLTLVLQEKDLKQKIYILLNLFTLFSEKVIRIAEPCSKGENNVMKTRPEDEISDRYCVENGEIMKIFLIILSTLVKES